MGSSVPRSQAERRGPPQGHHPGDPDARARPSSGGIFAPLMRAVEEDLAGYSEDELALILGFMNRHAATLQRITIEERKADDPRSQ